VLLWDQNHPSNALAWEVRAARERFQVRWFSVPLTANSIDEVVGRVSAALSPRTRVVSFTHISNVTGFRLPAAEICAALRQRHQHLFIHIDGAQTWGVRDVDLAAIDCDSFSGSAHKWLMGPRETGLLYVRGERLDEVEAAVVSIPWGSDVEPSVEGARRFEALGQRDDAAIAALAETVAWHAALTPAAVEQRATAIADRLREALAEIDVPFVSSAHPDFRSNVIILAASAEALRELPQRILEHSGVITAATGGLRMSPHIYNTGEHVERVVAAVAHARHQLGGVPTTPSGDV
jgi:selenocysteine lyase/cysteine desulfurase